MIVSNLMTIREISVDIASLAVATAARAMLVSGRISSS